MGDVNLAVIVYCESWEHQIYLFIYFGLKSNFTKVEKTKGSLEGEYLFDRHVIFLSSKCWMILVNHFDYNIFVSRWFSCNDYSF